MAKFRVLEGGKKLELDDVDKRDDARYSAAVAHLLKLNEELTAATDHLQARSAIRTLVLSHGVAGTIAFLKHEQGLLEELRRLP